MPERQPKVEVTLSEVVRIPSRLLPRACVANNGDGSYVATVTLLQAERILRSVNDDFTAGRTRHEDIQAYRAADDGLRKAVKELTVIAVDIAACRIASGETVAERQVPKTKVATARRVLNKSTQLYDAVRSGDVRLAYAKKLLSDKSFMTKLADGYGGDIAALAQAHIARSEKVRVKTVTLAVNGPDAWSYAKALYSAEGALLGQGYYQPKQYTADDYDVYELVQELCEEVCGTTNRTVIQAALTEESEIRAIFKHAVAVAEHEFETTPLTVQKRRVVQYLAQQCAKWS